ncbi:MAG TPA: sulfatase [Solirubrobacterales bacterium]|nr:sulfatase [Solirubrobacterales bacterium]
MLAVFGALAVAAMLPTLADRTQAAEARPNVLVIETDDQTVESMRVMTNVNSLIGAQGATFQNSFVNFSLCCPSRATFLTGQYAHNHNVLENKAPTGGFDRFESLHGDNNLAVWLQDAGYHTAMIGKYLNYYANDPPVPPGWSEWHAVSQGSSKVYDYTLNVNGVLVKHDDRPSEFLQDVLTAKTVRFIDRRASSSQPFFLWLNYTSPHVAGPDPNPNPPSDCYGAAKPAPRHAHAFDSEPLPMPPNFNEADVSDKPAEMRNRPLLRPTPEIANIKRHYRCALESLLSVDEGVKKIVDALVADNELDNTLIIYTSDNGFFYGEHRLFFIKRHIYEESIRVPLMMRGPGIPAGVTIPDLSINADLAPTIVDAANATPGLVMDGRSLIPVARQPGSGRGRELLIEEPGFKAIRTERYMYAEHSTGEKELYDLLKDPFELQSRQNASAYASVKSLLAARLDQLRDCTGSDC